MPSTILYQWIDMVRQWFPALKVWQATGLAIFSYGVVLSEQCQISKVAESLGMVGRIPSVERRLRRWLSNPRIDVQSCCQAWIRCVWQRSDLPRAILLVDETKIADRVGIMMVSLAYEQRAIPLVWRCYRANSKMDYPQQGQVLMVWGLLAQVLNALPEDSHPLVQMDRGLGNSSNMLKALDDLGVAYLIRVKDSTTFTPHGKQKLTLKSLAKVGDHRRYRGKIFCQRTSATVSVHLIWYPEQASPWCLVTNDPYRYGKGYAVRMWQEESFRDLKSGGWQWQTTYVTTPQHAERLLLVLAVAYAWMITQGTFVLHHSETYLRQVTDDPVNKFSLFRTGLRFFKRMIYYDPKKIYLGLLFAPPYKPLC